MTILPNATSDHNGGSPPPLTSDANPQINSPTLTITIDGIEGNILPGDLGDEAKIDDLARRMAASSPPPNVRCGRALLDLDDNERRRFLDLVCSIDNVVFVGREGAPAELLSAIGSMIRFDQNDIRRSECGHRLVVEVMAFTDSLSGPSCQIATRILRNAGYKGIQPRQLLSEARAFRGVLEAVAQHTRGAQNIRVKTVFPEAPVSDAVVVPDGWIVDQNGVRADKTAPINAPVVIVELCRDEQRGVESLNLGWRVESGWRTRVVERAIVACSRRIVSLANLGFPVNSENARGMVRYLADFENANGKCIPWVNVAHQFGWCGCDGFLLGHRYVTETAIFEKVQQAHGRVYFRGADLGDDQIADGFHASGSLGDWIAAIAAPLQYSVPWFTFAAGFVPIVAQMFKVSNFAVSLSGPTSVGKTAILRIVASIYGCPSDQRDATVIFNWNSTAVFRDRLAGISRHVPVILDETQHARDPGDVAKGVYGMTQGRAKQRGTILGIAGQDPIETVLFLSGERPASDFTQQDGGTRARVCEFWGAPFAGVPDAGTMVNAFLRGISDNYGHAAPQFIQFMFSNRNSWQQWVDEFRHKQTELEILAGDNNVAIRMSAYLAAVYVVSKIVHEALALPWAWRDPIGPVWEQLTTDLCEADRAAAALRHLMSYAAGNPDGFGSSDNDSGPNSFREWVGRWERPQIGFGGEPINVASHSWIGFLPHRLTLVLTQGGFNPETIVRQWLDRGWLDVDSGRGANRSQKTVRLAGKPTKMVVVKQSAIDAVMNLAKVEKTQPSR